MAHRRAVLIMKIKVNGAAAIDWADFIAVNQFTENETRMMLASLKKDGLFFGGGGATAPFVLAVETKPTLLDQAIANDDQDEAIKLIADALGITEGDVAGQVFSGPDNDSAAWRSGSIDWRKRQIGKWLNAECLYAGEGA